MVQKRGNLKHKHSEEFSLDRFRALLGVEKGKLERFLHLRQRAIDPAFGGARADKIAFHVCEAAKHGNHQPPDAGAGVGPRFRQ
jgi:hypothetical protein